MDGCRILTQNQSAESIGNECDICTFFHIYIPAVFFDCSGVPAGGDVHRTSGIHCGTVCSPASEDLRISAGIYRGIVCCSVSTEQCLEELVVGLDAVCNSFSRAVSGQLDDLVIFSRSAEFGAQSGQRAAAHTGAKQVTDFLYIGVLHSSVQEASQSPFDDTRLTKTLKVMGDKSKFEILRILSDDHKFGLELAQALDISTATISHHMSQLEEMDLIRCERESNRVYYSLNRETVEYVVKNLSKLFLED